MERTAGCGITLRVSSPLCGKLFSKSGPLSSWIRLRALWGEAMIPVGVVGKRGRSNRVAELIPQVSVGKHGSVFCDGNFVTGKICAADKRSVFFEKMKITVVGYGKIAVWHKGQTATMGTVTKAELTGRLPGDPNSLLTVPLRSKTMTFMVWESMTKRSPLFGLIAIAWALEKPPVDQSSPHAVPMTAVKFASTVFACLGMSLRA